MKKLILASTSPYRKELLSKLDIPFEAKKPLVDEDAHKDPTLSPLDLAQKLARVKAQSLCHDQQIVIGGDQLVAFDGRVLGKSHTPENAFMQLSQMQGREHQLLTAVCIYNGQDIHKEWVNITKLRMKSLTDKQIRRYLELDKPFDCAGSYKIESHGLALFEQISCSDFSAIQGLPLMELASALQELKIMPLGLS